MTDDFKKNILDYVTNNVTTTSPQERYSFLETQTLSSDLWTGDILPANYTEFKYTGIIASNENTSNLSVMYGYYYDNVASKYKGIITLLNENLEPIKSFFQYDSGTDLQPILGLEQSDDNNFYGVDATLGTLTNRFIMLNNFTIKNTNGEYQLTLRKTYNFASNYVIGTCFKMYKNLNSSHYVIFGQVNQTIKVIELTVNVGEENDWNLKSYSAPSDTTYQSSGVPIAQFDEDDNVFWRFLYSEYGTSSSSIKALTKNYNSSTATTTTLLNGTSNYLINNLNDYSFKSSSVVFFSASGNHINGSTYTFWDTLFKYDFSSSNLTTLIETPGQAMIRICNSEVYVASYGYFTRLEDDEFILWFEHETITYGHYPTWFLVKSNYNLVSILTLTSDINNTTQIPNGGWLIKDNYNSLNYNGYEYTDYNSMIPVQGTLYSNNSLVFARNLYDKTINNNTTTSTIVVPNSYLNDVNIDTQNLLSETNSEMVENENTITKNVYETGYFNFINTLNVIDNNGENTVFLNNVASYINENINTGTQVNCEDSFIRNLRVTYEDNSTMETGLVWYKASDTEVYTEFALTLTQPILQIDLMSNDFSTSYLTIIPDNLEVGNTYKFTQYLKIE